MNRIRFLAMGSALFFAAFCSVRAQVSYESYREFTIYGKTGVSGVNTVENKETGLLVRFDFDSDAGWLRITLTNLSGTTTGGVTYGPGVLTGFGFDVATGFSVKSGTFSVVGNGSDTSLGQFTTLFSNFDMKGGTAAFDYGTGADTGSGSPTQGLSGGATMFLNLQFTGTLSNFNAAYWFSNNGSDPDVGARFQATANNQSDKVTYVVPDVLLPIPEPSTYAMAGAAVLAGLAAWRRRRNR